MKNLAPINEDTDKVTKKYVDDAIDGIPTSNTMGVVVHGSTAGTARPAGYAQITWIGSVEPSNSAANDMWINTQ